jgi:hypothetical protein
MPVLVIELSRLATATTIFGSKNFRGRIEDKNVTFLDMHSNFIEIEEKEVPT